MPNLKTKSWFVPFTKVADSEDGSCVVEGIATQEILDTQGEIVAFDASVAAFTEWADYFAKATDGASVGNIREMHGDVAAGKALAWWPIEDQKAIGLRCKIIDPVAATKCRERVYTGFSIAAPGPTVNRIPCEVDGKKAQKITSYRLSEVSVVDKAAVPTALFSLVKRDVEKDVSGVISNANEAIASLKTLIASYVEMPGEPDTWTIQDLAYALSCIIGAKISAEAQVAVEAIEAIPEAGPAEPAGTTAPDEPKAAAATIDPVVLAQSIADEVKKQIQESQSAIGKADGEREEIMKAVRTASDDLQKAVAKLAERIDSLEQRPAPAGRPVQKTIGSAGNDVPIENNPIANLIAEVEKAERAGTLTPQAQMEVRKLIAAAMIPTK